MDESLHFDNSWEKIFNTQKPKLSDTERLHLIFSLIIQDGQTLEN